VHVTISSQGSRPLFRRWPIGSDNRQLAYVGLVRRIRSLSVEAEGYSIFWGTDGEIKSRGELEWLKPGWVLNVRILVAVEF
jgi:hypothetical protein